MTGTTPTMNPVTGLNAFANGTYGQPLPGFWGSSFGGNTPFGFGAPTYQPQLMSPIHAMGAFTPQLTPQTFQQSSIFGQPTFPWQTPLIGSSPMGVQGILNSVLQTTPPQVVNTILQTCPPQVLPYILNALACQQACQQVLEQNPQAVLGINPQAITHPFPGTFAQGGVGFGINRTPFVGGFQPQVVPPYLQAACVGCAPGQQWAPQGFPGVFGQVVPQQPWFNTTFGTW
jgi:hypothetical protein